MRKAGVLWAALSIALMASGVAAQETNRQVGDWLVNTKPDRFNDGQTSVIVMTTQNGAVFAVRCMLKVMSFALVDKSRTLEVGGIYRVRLRADRNPVLDTLGQQGSDRILAIEATNAMLQQLGNAREFAVRVEGTSYSADYTFRSDGGKGAMEPVFRECGISRN